MRILVDTNTTPLTRQEYEDILFDYFGVVQEYWHPESFEVLRNDKLLISMSYYFDNGLLPAHVIISDEGLFGISEEGNDVDFV